jgi:hypothetical protein
VRSYLDIHGNAHQRVDPSTLRQGDILAPPWKLLSSLGLIEGNDR